MNKDFEKQTNTNLICGILLALFANLILGVAIIILNEFKLKPAIKNNNIDEIEFTQKIIKALIIIAFIFVLINFIFFGLNIIKIINLNKKQMMSIVCYNYNIIFNLL